MANDGNETTTVLVAGATGTAVAMALSEGCFDMRDSIAGALLLLLLISQWKSAPRGLGIQALYSLAMATALVLTLGITADIWQFAGQCGGPNRSRDMTLLILTVDFFLLFALLRWFTGRLLKS
ncbi:MAG: hypothetical protein H7841_02295 [Magnetospirillum sp. WYHS-4]